MLPDRRNEGTKEGQNEGKKEGKEEGGRKENFKRGWEGGQAGLRKVATSRCHLINRVLHQRHFGIDVVGHLLQGVSFFGDGVDERLHVVFEVRSLGARVTNASLTRGAKQIQLPVVVTRTNKLVRTRGVVVLVNVVVVVVVVVVEVVVVVVVVFIVIRLLLSDGGQIDGDVGSVKDFGRQFRRCRPISARMSHSCSSTN